MKKSLLLSAGSGTAATVNLPESQRFTAYGETYVSALKERGLDKTTPEASPASGGALALASKTAKHGEATMSQAALDRAGTPAAHNRNKSPQKKTNQ